MIKIDFTEWEKENILTNVNEEEKILIKKIKNIINDIKINNLKERPKHLLKIQNIKK